MGRSIPRYLLRDRATHYRMLSRGSHKRTYSDPVEFRCHWEGGSVLRSAEGRHREIGIATVYVPLVRDRVRTVRKTRLVEIVPRQVGATVGSTAYPHVGSHIPFYTDREEKHTVTTQHDKPYYEVEDRIVFKGRSYQIVDIEEYDSPRGPEHYKLIVKDQRVGMRKNHG